jgi:hypothetical protein
MVKKIPTKFINSYDEQKAESVFRYLIPYDMAISLQGNINDFFTKVGMDMGISNSNYIFQHGGLVPTMVIVIITPAQVRKLKIKSFLSSEICKSSISDI